MGFSIEEIKGYLKMADICHFDNDIVFFVCGCLNCEKGQRPIYLVMSMSEDKKGLS